MSRQCSIYVNMWILTVIVVAFTSLCVAQNPKGLKKPAFCATCSENSQSQNYYCCFYFFKCCEESQIRSTATEGNDLGFALDSTSVATFANTIMTSISPAPFANTIITSTPTGIRRTTSQQQPTDPAVMPSTVQDQSQVLHKKPIRISNRPQYISPGISVPKYPSSRRRRGHYGREGII